MALQIVERARVTVVGMAIATKPMSPDIPALWPRFLRVADGPYFERYDEDFDPANPQSTVQIFLPVRERSLNR